MKYNKFTAMINPFINARWNSIMFPPEALETTINISIQQIYNEYKWSWLVEDESLSITKALWDNFIKELLYPVKYHIGLSIDWADQSVQQSINDVSDGSYAIKWKDIIVWTEWDYEFTYLRWYEFLWYKSDSSLEMPIPEKCIPALYYLVLSQLDLIDVQQLQWQPTSNFTKYQYEISNLKLDDIWYEQTLISGNAQ